MVTTQVSNVTVEKNTWKRCAAHVHISHLIQSLQMPENQGRFLLQSNQLRLQKEPNLGSLMALNSFHGVKNSFNSTIFSTTCNSTDERKSNEAKTGILWPQQLHHDQPHAALASEVYTPQKQVSSCICQWFLPFQFSQLIHATRRVSISCPC